jgi:predicted solute-binding protein
MSQIGHNKPVVTINALTEGEKKQVRDAVLEMNDSMTRVAAERDLQKEILNRIAEELGLDKKLVRRMAKVYFKSNYMEEVEENKNFEDFYNGVVRDLEV